MNIFSKYLKHKREETIFKDLFQKIEKGEIKTKNIELYSQINSATMKISSYFENCIKKFPSLFESNLKTFEESLSYLEKIAIPNKCVCASAVNAIPGWRCVDCSKYNNSLYCNNCYINSKDLHKGHKIQFSFDLAGMCDCGDPDSLYTYCHEHSGPFTEQSQIDDYIEKSFGKKVVENLRKFFDEFFLEYSKYLILTSKCELFMEDLFDEKFNGDLNADLIIEKDDVYFLKNNFKIVFENLIYFLRLVTKKNLGMFHLIANYFIKNNLESIKLEGEYKTYHRCIEINNDEIKVYYDTVKKENHYCICPFLRHFLTNYRNNIKLNSEEDEKEFFYSFVHNLQSRYFICILYFFLYNQILYNNNSIVMYCSNQFYLDDVIELIAKKTSFIENSVDIFYKFISKIIKNKENQENGILKDYILKKLLILITGLKVDINYFLKPKSKLLMFEKTSYFKKIIDIICLFHNIYEYKSIVPHPSFQDKSPKNLLFKIEKCLIKISGLLNCCLDFEKIDILKEIYQYIINKILNQEKEGIKQLKENEFSFFLILYRSFSIFINAFCFNHSFINNCTLLVSINFFKKTFFESQEQIENLVDIILKDYFKFFGFLCGTKNDFFKYYDKPNLYFGYYTEIFSYQNDVTLLKYIFALTERKIDINSYLKLSNIENVYSKFDQIFNLGKIIEYNPNIEHSKEKTETFPEINENNLVTLNDLSEEEKRRFILRLVLNEGINKKDKKQDEFNIIMQWKILLEFLIYIIKDDSSCYFSLIKYYHQLYSSKTQLDLYNNIKVNKYAMEDLKNILQKNLILNIISYKNLIDKRKLEKNLEKYFIILFEENNIYNQTLDKLTYNKMDGETKMFYLKDEYLKLIDCNDFINPKDKSEAQKYIFDFKKDIVKTFNYNFYNPAELTFEFFSKVYEKVFLNKDNLELILRVIEKLINDDSISELLDKKSIRNSFLPIIFNYLQIFNLINTKSFIEFKVENKSTINKIYELLENFINNNEKSNIVDKDLEENIKEIFNQMNLYKLVLDHYGNDLTKLNEYDYNVQIVEQLRQNNNSNSDIINLNPGNINNVDSKKQKSKNMKEKLKLLMKNKSNNFLKTIEDNEEMVKAIDEHINDVENMINNDDEIMCFYCRNSIKLNSFEKPFGKLGLCIKDLFYINSIKATLRQEFSTLDLKDKDKLLSESMKMIYNQGYFRIISCGHYFHNSCFIEGCQKGDKVGFNCPVCLKYENILMPPLTLFHDKYPFLQTEKLKELFNEGGNEQLEKVNKTNEKIDINNEINLFSATVMNFLISINFFKNNIKNYTSYLDNIFHYYKAFLNYFENIFYVDGTTFHKQQQIDNMKNIILSLRLIFHDSKECYKFEIVKFIKESLLKLANGPEENRFLYKYYDSYLHYLNLFDKILLSLVLLFDYEELKEIFKYLIYIYLPYFCFGLFFKSLIIQKQNKDIDDEQFKQKLNLVEFNKYLQENNKHILNDLNSFLTKFCLIKLISDYKNKNENIINNINGLPIQSILSLLDMNDLLKQLPIDKLYISDVINILPKTFDENNVFFKHFSSVLNFDNILNSILDNGKKYIIESKINLQITHELIIQCTPTKFSFYPLEQNIFDFLEKNIGKTCQECGKIHKSLFMCLICGEKICKNLNTGTTFDALRNHTYKCQGDYCIYLEMVYMNLYYIHIKGSLIKLFPIYINKAGTGPMESIVTNEFNLNHEKLKMITRDFISKDFHFK